MTILEHIRENDRVTLAVFSVVALGYVALFVHDHAEAVRKREAAERTERFEQRMLDHTRGAFLWFRTGGPSDDFDEHLLRFRVAVSNTIANGWKPEDEK